ncbi:MAG: hypothetical protein IJX12_05595, partial [Lachnospiraceae bacterium]|nr:hypothetical protein [Lachnospiraceae bacterium]
MGQTVDNGLNFTNINHDIYKQGQDLRTGSDFGMDKTKIGAVDEELVTGYKYERGNSSLVNSTVDNFEEYLKKKQEKAKEAGEDAATEERQAKEDAKEISRSLSGEEIKQLKMMGIDVEGARLSDLMGMVNTLRGEANRQEMQQLLAGASAGKGDMEGITLVGGVAKLAGTDIELDNVDVSDVLVNQEPNVNREEPSGESFKLGQEELVYIIKNNLSFSKDNMYKAHYSGSVISDKGISKEILKEMQPQIDKVIEQAGFLGELSATEGATFLMDNNLPVTTDNLRTYMSYQDYLGKDVAEVDFSSMEKELLTGKEETLFKEVAALKPEVAYDMVYSGRQLTIASITSYTKSVKGKVSDDAEKMYAKFKDMDVVTEDMSDFSKEDLKAVTAMRQIEEIRLSMTVSAASKLVKSDLNIDTRELSKVVNQLKNLEEQMIRNKLKEAGVQPTDENISLYNEITDKIQGLGEKPAAALGAPFRGLTFSVNVLYEESAVIIGKESGVGEETDAEQGKSLNSEQALLMARKSY